MKHTKACLLSCGAMVAVLASCTSGSAATTTSSGPTRSAGVVVSWVALPAPTTTTTTTTTTTLAPATRCSTSVLRVRVGGALPALGNVAIPVSLTNVGSSPCRLAGYPVLVGVYSARRQSELSTRHGTYFGDFVPADLQPGAAGELLIAGNDQCLDVDSAAPAYPSAPYAVTFRSIVVRLPDDTGSFSLSRLPRCGPIDETQLGRAAPVAAEFVPTPGTLPFLSAHAQLPVRLRAGRTVDYLVALANPGARPVSLVPCPGYSESLGLYVDGRWLVEQRSYGLNCDAVRVVPPGRSVTFAMQIPVPAGAQSGGAKLGWSLNTGNGPYAGGIVELSP